MNKKIELCVYIADWETIETFKTYEEAKRKLDELVKTQPMNYAIIQGDNILYEYKY